MFGCSYGYADDTGYADKLPILPCLDESVSAVLAEEEREICSDIVCVAIPLSFLLCPS